jgi:hypothetical protein
MAESLIKFTDKILRTQAFLKMIGMCLSMTLMHESVAADSLWIDAGDPDMRNDLQILSDAGVLSAPMTSYPLSWDALAEDLQKANPANLEPWAQSALHRLSMRMQTAQSPDLHGQFAMSAYHTDEYLNWYENFPQGNGEVLAQVGSQAGPLYYRLSVQGVVNPDDDHSGRLDGSYLAGKWGNWILSAGALDRWWGPGWGGGLILSNNARPVPALAIQRNRSTPFDLPVLRWLGPWTVTTFMGRMESDRDIAHPLMFGLRFAFKPTSGLEIGFSRTALWCGEGRKCTPRIFGKLLAGQDNQGTGANSDEPGDQLAGGDLRWSFALLGQPLAVYGEWIGEDEAGGVPSRALGQFGIETWGGLGSSDRSYRIFLEFADTTSNFYSSSPTYNYAYESHIYKTGYRYYDQPIGYSTDNDSRIGTLGLMIDLPDDRSASLILRQGQLNRDNQNLPAPAGNVVAPEKTNVTEAVVELNQDTSLGRFTLGVGAANWDVSSKGRDIKGIGYVQWSFTY